MTHIKSHPSSIPSSELLTSVSQFLSILERYLIVDSRVLSWESNILFPDINLNFHHFLPLCPDSLSENPWRLFVFPLHRCCHQLASLEIVLIVGVYNACLKAYWIPNSCRHSFHGLTLFSSAFKSLSVIPPWFFSDAIDLLLLSFDFVYWCLIHSCCVFLDN